MLRLIKSAPAAKAFQFTATRGFAASSLDVTLNDEAFTTYVPDNLEIPFPGPVNNVSVGTDELLEHYKAMSLMRRVETTADNMYKAKLIRGFCHLYTGQEAVCQGMASALTKDDPIVTAYRDHCWSMVRGDTPRGVLAELLGRTTGSAKGKGGSMHMYNRSENYFGGNGIVGAQVPLGAGLAFALHFRGNPNGNVAITLYGDGASNQGQIFEALNMAHLWKLPLILVCENNHYGMGTSSNRSSAETRYYMRGQYTPGVKVDGMDVLAVKEATRYCKEWAAQNGPIVMEMNTYRYYGHSMSDPGLYRSRDEVKSVRESRDALEMCKRRIIDNDIATADEIKAIDKKIRKEVDEAANLAKNDPLPDAGELWTNVYSDNEQVFLRGVELHLSNMKP